nr:lipoprotein 17-related variable surface protein [uncultured Treponema sp.]
MKRLILCITAVIAIGMTSCNSPLDHKGSSETPGVPSTPPQNPYELVEADVFEAFSLSKGHITASAAAKKITNGTPASGITFTERKMIAYDDQAGTFTVEVKGTKDGKNFSQKISVTGFTHPLAGKTIQSIADCELNLDDAIEHNYSLAKYIEEVKKDPSGKKLVKKLSFMLSDSVTTIELGEHDSYTLVAEAQAVGTKVWVQPSVVFRKLTEGGTETLVKNTEFSFTHLNSSLKKDYFEAKDVFKYILDKTADIAVKADPKEFASSFYAFAKKSGQAPANLFTEGFKTKIQDYAALYQNKDSDELLALDISYGAFQPKNGGIDADDYTGTVTIKLCIATNEQIVNQNDITAIKPIEKSGFASIPDNAALAKKNHLFFNLIPKSSLSPADKTNWKNKVFSRALLRINESNNAIIDNPFGGSDSLFNLCVNSENTNPATYLGSAGGSYGGASKTKNNKVIFIENIQLEKKANSTSMEVLVKLKGSGPVLKVTTEP